MFSRPQNHTLFLSLFLAGSATFASCDNQKPVTQAIPSGTDILNRVLLAEERVSYQARQTVLVSNSSRTEAMITDETSYGGGKGRVSFVMPASAAGRTVIRDGKTRWTVEPTTKTVIQSDITHMPVHPGKAKSSIDKVIRSYKVSVAKELSEVAGRRAYVVELIPIHNDRPRRKWWVDKQTAFVLKREVFDIKGTLEQTSSYSNVVFNPKPSPALLSFVKPAGYRIIKRRDDNAVHNLEIARKLLPSSKEIPASLGNGFDFQSANIVEARGAKSIHVQYSDGLAGLSVFKMPGTTKMPPSGPRGREVLVGSVKGMIFQTIAPYRVVTWNSAGSSFNLVSDIAEETMIGLARRLHF
jgi:outer membrane lipoprotein-sorting protein